LGLQNHNFSDFAFVLGMTVFGRLGQIAAAGGKLEQVGLSPLANAHFNHCSRVAWTGARERGP